MKLRIEPRVGTALALIPLALGITLFGSQLLFVGLCALLILAGTWEWAGMADARGISRKIFAQVLTALLLSVCYYHIDSVLTLYIVILALFWWVTAAFLVISRKDGRKFNPGFLSQAVICMIVLVPAWVSLVALRAHADFDGPVLVACLFIVIWSADSGAYFIGQRWGRHKLAVHISPGKTREGLFGAFSFGLVAALLCALLWLPMSLVELLLFLLVCAIAIAASVIGDLTESLIKRGAGVKDSGELLPGHGGALDRIDSLTAAAPVYFSGVLLLEHAL